MAPGLTSPEYDGVGDSAHSLVTKDHPERTNATTEQHPAPSLVTKDRPKRTNATTE